MAKAAAPPPAVPAAPVPKPVPRPRVPIPHSSKLFGIVRMPDAATHFRVREESTREVLQVQSGENEDPKQYWRVDSPESVFRQVFGGRTLIFEFFVMGGRGGTSLRQVGPSSAPVDVEGPGAATVAAPPVAPPAPSPADSTMATHIAMIREMRLMAAEEAAIVDARVAQHRKEDRDWLAKMVVVARTGVVAPETPDDDDDDDDDDETEGVNIKEIVARLADEFGPVLRELVEKKLAGPKAAE